MRLGVMLGYWSSGMGSPVELALAAEDLGYDSVWFAEAYGNDAVTQMTAAVLQTERIHVGSAVLQIPARSPAMTAMTAATLDQMSGGRIRLGLGLSGPQVAEGWHGMPYTKPLARTREYVDIVRAILRRDERVAYDGEVYRLPVPGGLDLGKPLKLIIHPIRSEIPVYLAAIGPKNTALAGEIADGWLPAFYMPEHAGMFREWLAEGAARSHRDLATLDVAVGTMVVMDDDVEAAMRWGRPGTALYLGGMGARSKNFYNELACRYGYEEAARTVQDLYLAGRKEEAMAAVPADLLDATGLFGPKERIAERIARYRDAGVTTLIVGTVGTLEQRVATLRALAEMAA